MRNDSSNAITDTDIAPPIRQVGRRTFQTGLALGALIMVVIGVFIFQNNAGTDLRYLWFDFRTPLWIGLLMSFGAGFASGPLCVWGWRHRRPATRSLRRRR